MEKDLVQQLQEQINPVNINTEDIDETDLINLDQYDNIPLEDSCPLDEEQEETTKETKKGTKKQPVDEDGKTYDDYIREMGLEVPNENGHYVDNNVLYEHMVKYCDARDKALAEGKEKPPIDNYIGECIMKIATHLSFRPNFLGYSYRQDMIGDAIDNCLTYIDSFDPKKSKNAFSYITQICWCAFIRRLKLEKRNSIIKGKYMMSHSVLNNMTFDDDEERNVYDNNVVHTYMEMAQEEEDKQKAIKAEKKAEKLAKKEAERKKTALEEYFG